MGGRRVKIGLMTTDLESANEISKVIAASPKLELTGILATRLQLAQEFSQSIAAIPCASLERLTTLCDAVVISDAGWIGEFSIIRLLQRGCPVLTMPQFSNTLGASNLAEITSTVRESGAMFLPGLINRWTRASLRVRELTATKLGAIDWMNCSLPEEQNEILLSKLDWISSLVQSPVESVLSRENGQDIELRFRRKVGNGESVTATINVREGLSSENGSETAMLQCRHGEVRILGNDHIEWKTDRKIHQEDLSQDRAPLAVMLDLFGRRVVGGLVPVPDVMDLNRCHALLEATRQSNVEAKEVSVIWPEVG